MRGIGGLVREARRRRVFRAAGLYVIAAWGLLQVLDLAFSSWDYPTEALRYVWMAALLCFPIAVVFGWRYDVTADGIVRTPPPDPSNDIDLSLRRFDYLLLAALAVVASVVSTSTFHRVISVDPPVVEPGPIQSIAVLPFVNMSGTEGSDFFSDGLAEETTSLLADLGEIRVAARSSAFYFKDRDYTIADVVDRLAVDAVLEGSVRRQDQDVRVTAQLVDTGTESILWTETYDRRLEDVIAIQADIALQVTDALEIVLSSRSEKRLQRIPTKSTAAYDAYLMGREFLRRPKTAETFESAVDSFKSAVDQDPGFAGAHAGLCEARLGQYELTREANYFEQAEAACLRALTRDGDATGTYLALAYLHFFAGRHDQAEEEFKHVIDVNETLADAYLGLARNYAAKEQSRKAEAAFHRAIEVDAAYWDGYQLFGNFLFSRGRYAEAASNYRKVIDLTPDNAHAHANLGAAYYMAGDFKGAASAFESSLAISPTRAAYSNTGSMYYYLGDFSAAAQMYRKALEITPDDGRMWGNLGDALWAAGSLEDAREAYEKARQLMDAGLSISPDDTFTLASLAYFSARLGDDAEADRLLALCLENDPEDFYTHYYAALIHAGRGDADQAIRSLERTLDLGYQPKLLTVDPALRSLHAEPRFKELLDENVDENQ